MVVIADNDMVLKLAAFDLLDAAAALFGVSTTEIRVLDSAKYLFRKRRNKLSAAYTEQGVDRAIAFAENATSIIAASDPAEVALLFAIERIDAGEAILFAAAGVMADAVLVTGDKRAMTALAQSAAARRVYDRLANRVVCLEALLEGLILRLGFTAVKSHVLPGLECDKAVRAVFGSRDLAAEGAVLAGLAGYISNLETSIGTEWLYRFETMQ